MTKAIQITAVRRPRGDAPRRPAGRRARPGRDPHPPPRLRPELHRRLPAHRPVREPAAADAGHGGRRRRRGGGRGRHAPEGRRPRRLRQQPAGQLQRGARDAGQDGVQAARRHRLRHRRRHDAQGPDGAVPAEEDAAGRGPAAGRLRAVPRRGRRRRPDRLPVGQGAGAAADRHRRQRRQCAAGARARRGACHRLQQGGLRRARQGHHRRQGRQGGLRLGRQGHLRQAASTACARSA